MKAVYDIRNCSGQSVDRVEVSFPGNVDPTDSDARVDALRFTDYWDRGICSHCGRPAFRACYIGYPVPDLVDVIGKLETKNQGDLIAALEAILKHLRNSPDSVNSITCDVSGGCLYNYNVSDSNEREGCDGYSERCG